MFTSAYASHFLQRGFKISWSTSRMRISFLIVFWKNWTVAFLTRREACRLGFWSWDGELWAELAQLAQYLWMNGCSGGIESRFEVGCWDKYSWGIRSAPRIQSPLKLGTTFIMTHRVLHLNWDKTYYFFTVYCSHPAYMTLWTTCQVRNSQSLKTKQFLLLSKNFLCFAVWEVFVS